MADLEIRLQLSKWRETVSRQIAELQEIEREIDEYAQRLSRPLDFVHRSKEREEFRRQRKQMWAQPIRYLHDGGSDDVA